MANRPEINKRGPRVLGIKELAFKLTVQKKDGLQYISTVIAIKQQQHLVYLKSIE